MRKAVRTPEELNALLTAELRRAPGCEGAAWVRIYRLRRHVRGRNWLAAFLSAGSADKGACARALIEIERRLQAEFDLVPEAARRERSRPFLGDRRYHRRLPSRLLPPLDAPQSASMIARLGAVRSLLASKHRRREPARPFF